MLVSNESDQIKRARHLSTQAKEDAPYYEHTEIGYNYRMSNVLAGIGRGQLQVLDKRVDARRSIFNRYEEGLSNIRGLNLMPVLPDCRSNRWLSAATLDPQCTDITVPELIATLAEHNIEARHAWKPMHMQPVFHGCTFYSHSGGSNCSAYLFEHGICFPSASSMTEEEQQRVVATITELFECE